VRETALEQLDEEVPYSVACEIEEFRESRTPVYIRLCCSSSARARRGSSSAQGHPAPRDRQGRAREDRGTRAAPVYLDLWVKVLPTGGVTCARFAVFGYTLPKEQSR
jgi:hypothetical protein